jgi:hypothetical protein
MNKQLKLFVSVKDQIGTKRDGNSKMVDYGIQNEQSDYRVHVCYLAQHIYIFPTSAGRKALDEAIQRNDKKRIAFQRGVKHPTGKGYAIPISYIDSIREILIPHDLFSRYTISKYDSTTTKGKKAISIVIEMLRRGLIALPLNVDIIEDKDIQIKGGDITIHSKLVLQVKCDFKGGDKKYNKTVTGNLFLQIAECNPKGMY